MLIQFINSLVELLTNKVFISAAFAWFLSQTIKSIIEFIKQKKTPRNFIFESGGFPSSHSAVVCALSTALYIETQISYIFIVSLILAFIVIQDSYKVRYQLQKHAHILNKADKKAGLNEKLGHKISEIAGGIVLGIITTVVVYIL